MIITEGKLTMRWAKAPDFDQLADLLRACYPADRWTPADLLRFAEHKNPNVVKILVDDKAVVYGGLLYTVDDVVRVRRVAVWPDYRRKGLGRHMVNFLTGPRSPLRRTRFSAALAFANSTGATFLTGIGFSEDDPADGCRRFSLTK